MNTHDFQLPSGRVLKSKQPLTPATIQAFSEPEALRFFEAVTERIERRPNTQTHFQKQP